MLRAVLELVLILVVARTFWRVVGGVMEGLRGNRETRVADRAAPDREVPMSRDPICGTFVLPERAVSLYDGRRRLFFCSAACRDKYLARTA